MSEDAPVKVGARAPDFTLKANTGESVSLDDFRDRKHVVLYFYPRDETPGCTREACSFRDLEATFAKHDTVILGVSLDATDSHAAFALHHKLTFPLLSDTDASVSKRYGVYREKILYGKSHWGIERTTFAVDKRGLLRKIWRRVKVDRHADEVLAFVTRELT